MKSIYKKFVDQEEFSEIKELLEKHNGQIERVARLTRWSPSTVKYVKLTDNFGGYMTLRRKINDEAQAKRKPKDRMQSKTFMALFNSARKLSDNGVSIGEIATLVGRSTATIQTWLQYETPQDYSDSIKRKHEMMRERELRVARAIEATSRQQALIKENTANDALDAPGLTSPSIDNKTFLNSHNTLVANIKAWEAAQTKTNQLLEALNHGQDKLIELLSELVDTKEVKPVEESKKRFSFL